MASAAIASAAGHSVTLWPWRCAACQRMRRNEPEVPGEHQQREQHQRDGDAYREIAEQLAGVFRRTTRQMEERRAKATEDDEESHRDQQPQHVFHTLGV